MLKLALTCSIAGIFLLCIISENVKLEERTIFEAKQMDGKVRITGTVENIRHSSGLTILTVSKKESIDVVYFDNTSFVQGDFIDVTGEIDDYNGKKQIIADEIELG